MVDAERSKAAAATTSRTSRAAAVQHKMFEIFPPDLKIDFVGKDKIAVGISLVVILTSLAFMIVRGFNWGVDFNGGILAQVRFEHDVSPTEVHEGASSLGFGEAEAQPFENSSREFLIRIDTRGKDEKQLDLTKVQPHFVEKFGPGTQLTRIESVGPKVGKELIQKGALALFWSLIAMLAYIWFRFTLDFGMGAIFATFHDVMVMLGAFSIFHREINLPIVAALLTIVGYSMNDTIILFDRIRENLARRRKSNFPEIVNMSINETLSRTILTSLTVFLSSLALFMVGGGVIHDFAFAMLVGVITGTWSSIFIASPITMWWRARYGAPKSKS
jgi:preprotein translocase subunit SecF